MAIYETNIGGEGITVEINESLFGKRKYHRGGLTNDQWVDGGVERPEERKWFFVLVEKRDTETLQFFNLYFLIKFSKKIWSISIVVSFFWKNLKTKFNSSQNFE